MSIIKSFDEIQDENLEAISKLCHSSNEPVVITKNGCSDIIVMSVEVYEKIAGLETTVKLIDRYEERLASRGTSQRVTLSEAMAEVRRECYGESE